jgi:hypothetical protein
MSDAEPELQRDAAPAAPNLLFGTGRMAQTIIIYYLQPATTF